jgi:arginase
VKVSVIAVPFDSGLRDARMGRGPRAVLEAGLVERLREAGATVHTTFIEPPDDLFPAQVPVTFALLRRVADEVAAARADGAFPLVLSGNCNSALGTVTGMRRNGRHGAAVCWFDAHADANTPETSPSGFLDGMGVAMLTGRCWQPLMRTLPDFEPLPDEHVALIGTRDVDPLEDELLHASRIHRVRPDELSARLPAVLDSLSRCPDVYVHVDLDVLDPSEGRANGYAAPGGLSLEALRGALRCIQRRLPVGAAALTAYDPAEDPSGRIGRAAVDLAVLLVRDDGAVH